MAGEGALLRQARENKGWTYYDVEDSIKIRVRYLEALENEEYGILPGNTYIKGFLRTYSKHLGINSEEILDLYNSSLTTEPSSQAHLPLTPIQSNPIWFRPIVLIIMGLLAAAIVLGITYYSKINAEPPASDYTPAPLPTAPQTQNNVQEPDPKAPVPEDNTPSGEQNPIIYEGIVAEMNFQEDCWLRVRVDGVIVQDGMSPAGSTKVFQGTERIEFLTIGNAGGLTMKLNGKDVPPLGVSKEVLRNYVVTKETVENL